MKYERIERATFLERPNRFIAYARIAGKQETIHVKNTGRCAELLVPEAEIFVQESDNPERKTKWDLIGVRKGNRLINMDSQIPNKVVEEWLRAGNLFLEPVTVRPETTYGNSRFDFYVESGEKKAFIEVKGVTLEDSVIFSARRQSSSPAAAGSSGSVPPRRIVSRSRILSSCR